MADGSRQIFTSEGRHRVAYEMAQSMWMASKKAHPNLEDQTAFLELVESCTRALAYRDG